MVVDPTMIVGVVVVAGAVTVAPGYTFNELPGAAMYCTDTSTVNHTVNIARQHTDPEPEAASVAPGRMLVDEHE